MTINPCLGQRAIRWRTIITGLPAKDGVETLLTLCPYVRQVNGAENNEGSFLMFR